MPPCTYIPYCPCPTVETLVVLTSEAIGNVRPKKTLFCLVICKNIPTINSVFRKELSRLWNVAGVPIYLVEMSNFPQNPGPTRNRHPTSFGRTQHQVQCSSLGQASSPVVGRYTYLFSIRPLMLSPALAQQPHVRPRKKPGGGSAPGPVRCLWART